MLRQKAKALARSGLTEEAEQQYKRAIESDPGNAIAHASYAGFLVDEKRFKEAVEEYERAVVANPSDGYRWWELGVTILNRGYARDSSGKIDGPINEKSKRLACTIPLFIRGIQQRHPGVVRSTVTVLVMNGALQEARQIEKGGADRRVR